MKKCLEIVNFVTDESQSLQLSQQQTKTICKVTSSWEPENKS